MIGIFTLWKIRKKWHNDINSKLNGIMRMVCKPEDELSVLCDIYGSDKGSMYNDCHTYTLEYFYLFHKIRDNVEMVFECGIGTNNPKLPSSMGLYGQPGASLRVWRDYFKNAQIVGVDIDKKILFEEGRIHTAYIDQTDPKEIEELFHSLFNKYQKLFDIMIDDGLHTFEAAICLFENSFHYLANNGYYIIEDMGYSDIPRFEKYFSDCKYNKEIIVDIKAMYTQRKPNNNIIILQKTGRN